VIKIVIPNLIGNPVWERLSFDSKDSRPVRPVRRSADDWLIKAFGNDRMVIILIKQFCHSQFWLKSDFVVLRNSNIFHLPIHLENSNDIEIAEYF